MTEPFTLHDFVSESNRIEGIPRVLDAEVHAHDYLLAAPALTVKMLSWFVGVIAHAPLRNQSGMNVRVGRHRPPAGSPEMTRNLECLLEEISGMRLSPFAGHVAYETLHPFMDGNGRSGRAVWLWQMGGIERAPLGFLHHFYYQSLDNVRGGGAPSQ